MKEPLYKKQKPLLNSNETILYERLKEAVGGDYLLLPQVHLEKLIAPRRGSFFGKIKYAVGHISRKSVDFALFDKETFEPLLAIELNGKSHNSLKTIQRDRDVRVHLEEAGVSLLTFQNDETISAQELRRAIDSSLANLPKIHTFK